MEIRYICTYWGQGHLPVNEFVAKAVEAGYDGIEIGIPIYEKFTSSALRAIENSGVSFIAQQYLQPVIESFDRYRGRLNEYLAFLAALNPIFINSHTGKDFYSFEENAILIEDCFRFSNQTGIQVFHETHRGRFSYHASNLLPYIDKFENLKLTADLSHFCVVSESLLEDQEDILDKILARCTYIHARVGFGQAAQVNHPFAPEWQTTLDRFVGWWQRIIELAKSKRSGIFYICPEFGPAPYMPTLPFTQQSVANQWDINIEMMKYLKKELK
ncbi:MAG: hypothetical protein M0Q53_09685 [Prolixibacteraceae bacterium]|jgi:sugar phosphate isomerase/epimerase|nr:hypothetical protein [Prolixibacteraceae bacterium]